MLEIHDTIQGFRAALDAERAAGRVVGLVPTMGYLHAGHASLLRRSAQECEVTALTIFVNPLQFAATEDLGTYPRDLESDLAIAEAAGALHVFTPSVAEMYPEPVLTTVSVDAITDRWEGAARPEHFAGVATVVAKLLAIGGAGAAYFGEKDFQQLAVVRRLVADLSLPNRIVGCPIIREADGLAMSSRNVYLTHPQRAAAPVLHRALLAAADEAARPGASPASVEGVLHQLIATEPEAELDYGALVSANTLEPAGALGGSQRLLVAARFGTTRLLDNLQVGPAAW